MSLDVLASLRAQGQQPAMACVTTDYATAHTWAVNAGLWPVVIEYGQAYDFAPLVGIPVVLALPQLKGPQAQRLASELLQLSPVIGFDLERNQTSIMVEA